MFFFFIYDIASITRVMFDSNTGVLNAIQNLMIIQKHYIVGNEYIDPKLVILHN